MVVLDLIWIASTCGYFWTKRFFQNLVVLSMEKTLFKLFCVINLTEINLELFDQIAVIEINCYVCSITAVSQSGLTVGTYVMAQNSVVCNNYRETY